MSKICSEGRMFLSDRGLNIPVCEKLGITSSNGEIHFPYWFNGELVRTKSRSMTDKKKMRFFPLKDGKNDLPFWNHRNWPTNDYIIVTEGEPDCVALTQLEASNCVSLPSGASSAFGTFKKHYDYLQKYDLIYIAFDMDEAGNKAAEEVKKIIPAEKYRRIIFPSKDANDWLLEYDPTPEDLQDLMRNAQKITFEEIVHFKHVPNSYMLPRQVGVSTGWSELDDCIGGIRLRELTTVSADTGAGKTTFCVNMLYNLVRNDPSGGFWINSWEMDHEAVIRKVASLVLNTNLKTKAFSQEQAEMFLRWQKENNVYLNPKRSASDLATLSKQIDLASRIYGVKYILLDHLEFISDTIVTESSEYKRINKAVQALHNMAMDYNVHIILIAHAKQTDSHEISMNQIRGGGGTKQYSDNVIILHNMSQSDLSNTDNRIRVRVEKSRQFGRKAQFYLRYLPEIDGYVDNMNFDFQSAIGDYYDEEN